LKLGQEAFSIQAIAFELAQFELSGDLTDSLQWEFYNSVRLEI
jgi:hypothetical protein